MWTHVVHHDYLQGKTIVDNEPKGGKMEQIKIFSSSDYPSKASKILEAEINTWLSAKQDEIQITSVIQSSVINSGMLIITVSIFYKNKEL